MNINHYVHLALQEDLGGGDLTTELLIAPNSRSEAKIIMKETAVVCGLLIAQQVVKKLDPTASFKILAKEGQRVRKGATIALLKGKTRALLTAERVALNFIGYLSGIATLTRQFVDAVTGTPAKILDTRKTTPGLRELEKYAVRCGGGANHRFSLHEMVLIKDNHLSSISRSIPAAIDRVRSRTKKQIEVEVDTVAQFDQALHAQADMILLDNMKPAQIRRCVLRRKGRKPLLEASGGVRLDNVKAFAKTGVDRISIGALTHSAPSIDVSLEITRTWTK